MNYKDPQNNLHFIDPAFAHMLPAGSVPITEEEAEDIRIANTPPPAPVTVISPRQIRQALTAAGLRAQVEAAVAAGNQDLKDWWEFATQFERMHPMVVAMGTGLGQTSQDMDDLWELAASL